MQGEIFEIDPAKLIEIGGGPFDLLLSDAAPKTTGVVFADHARSVELARRTLEIARAVVREGGAWLCKVFQGEDLPAFRAEARRSFRKLIEEKPKSSRDRSVEIFLLGLGRIGEERGEG